MSEQPDPIELPALRGSVAIITGAANNGIGWGLCRYVAGELGMHVVLVDLHAQPVREAQARLQAEFDAVTCVGVQADVTDPAALAACLARVQATFPDTPIGAVFANAGVIFNRTILKSTLEEWTTTFNVNVIGVVNTLKTFVPVLQKQAAPSVVVNTASIGGLVRGDGGGAAYQASKHAVVALSESLAFELAVKHPQIRVHVLCPCIVQSGLAETSKLNARVRAGELADSQVNALQPPGYGVRAMTPERHAQQVFDHIAAGNFYMITDNVRPYVDHDHPFDGLGLVRERMENMLELKLDNADAFAQPVNRPPSAILKGPFWQDP